MSNLPDPFALLRHAAQAGDVRLVDLVWAWLVSTPPPRGPVRRAYGTLVQLLQLEEQTGGAHDRRDDDPPS